MKKFAMTRAFIRDVIEETAAAQETLVAIPGDMLRSSDFAALTRAGFTWNGELGCLVMGLEQALGLDVRTLPFIDEPTPEIVEAMQAALSDSDTNADGDVGPADIDSDGEDLPSQPTNPANGQTNVNSPAQVPPPTNPMPGFPVRQTASTQVALSVRDPQTVQLSAELQETRRTLMSVVTNTRKEQAALILSNAAQRGVTAPVINFARLALDALAGQMSTDPILQLSQEDGGAELDMFGLVARLVNMVDGTVPTMPKMDGGKAPLAFTSDDKNAQDPEAVNATAKRLVGKR